MYLNLDELPGPAVDSISELKETLLNLNSVEKRFKQRRTTFAEKYGSVNDGSASKLIVDYVFNHVKNTKISVLKLHTNKKSILIYPGSLAGNGITSSYLNLVNKIDLDKFDVTQVTSLDKQFGLSNTKKVPKEIRQMFRIGNGLFTIDQIVADEVYKVTGFESDEVDYPEFAYENDFERLFPNTKFDIVIDFSGYSYSWGALLLGSQADQRIVWQHNDILADSQRMVGDTYIHKSNVEPLISIYHKFTKLISVSPVLRDLNLENLGAFYGNAKPEYARNTINIAAITKATWKQKLFIKLPKKDMFGHEIPKFNSRVTNFVTMGRLSPEKNQEFLIESFSQYVKNADKNARLYILGQGPLAEFLFETIEKYNMQENVFMLGHSSQPHILMRHMDVFVLPSLYEGQPMVLLEALTLGMKVISSNIPQNEYVLNYGKYGSVKNGTDVSEFASGLRSIVEAKKREFDRFNPEEYNNQAISDFYKILD